MVYMYVYHPGRACLRSFRMWQGTRLFFVNRQKSALYPLYHDSGRKNRIPCSVLRIYSTILCTIVPELLLAQ